MAATRLDIPLPVGTWVNLNTVSTIAVGTAVTLYNKGTPALLIVQASSTPAYSTIGIPLPANSQGLVVPTGALALWAFASGTGGNILIQD